MKNRALNLVSFAIWMLLGGIGLAQSIPAPSPSLIGQLPVGCQYIVGVIEREYRDSCPRYPQGGYCHSARDLDRLWGNLNRWSEVADRGGCPYPNPYTNSIDFGGSAGNTIVQADDVLDAESCNELQILKNLAVEYEENLRASLNADSNALLDADGKEYDAIIEHMIILSDLYEDAKSGLADVEQDMRGC